MILTIAITVIVTLMFFVRYLFIKEEYNYRQKIIVLYAILSYDCHLIDVEIKERGYSDIENNPNYIPFDAIDDRLLKKPFVYGWEKTVSPEIAEKIAPYVRDYKTINLKSEKEKEVLET